MNDEYEEYPQDIRPLPEVLTVATFASFLEECMNRNIPREEIGKRWLDMAAGYDGDPEDAFRVGCFLIAEKDGRFLCLPVDGIEAKTLRSVVMSKIHSGEECGIRLEELDSATLRPDNTSAPLPGVKGE